MAGIEFTVNATADEVRQNLGSWLQQAGYTVKPLPDGGMKAEIGSFTKTMLIGAMAGKDFHRAFFVRIGQAPQGTVVSVQRDTAMSALKGGAVGASKAQGYFEDFTRLLRGNFSPVLIGERPF